MDQVLTQEELIEQMLSQENQLVEALQTRMSPVDFQAWVKGQAEAYLYRMGRCETSLPDSLKAKFYLAKHNQG